MAKCKQAKRGEFNLNQWKSNQNFNKTCHCHFKLIIIKRWNFMCNG